MKAKLSSAEKELEEKNGQLKQLKANYDEQTKSLKQDIIEVASTFEVKKAPLWSLFCFLAIALDHT